MASPPHELPQAAIDAVDNGRKLDAIKIVRGQLGLELKEAKDLVDAYERTRQSKLESSPVKPTSERHGAWLWLAIAAVMAAAAYYFLR